MKLIFRRRRLAELVVVELVGVEDDPGSVNDVISLLPKVVTTTTCSVVVRLGVVLGIVVEVENVVGVVDILVVLVVLEVVEEDIVELEEEDVDVVVDELDDGVEVELVVLVVEVRELVVDVEDADEVEVVDGLVVITILVLDVELNELVELAELFSDNKLLNLGLPLGTETVTITVTSPSTPSVVAPPQLGHSLAPVSVVCPPTSPQSPSPINQNISRMPSLVQVAEFSIRGTFPSRGG